MGQISVEKAVKSLLSSGSWCACNVAGTSFISNSEKVLHYLQYLNSLPSDKDSSVYLRLEYEADNPYDENAVKVYAKSNAFKGKKVKIGYIPKKLSGLFRYILDSDSIVLTMTRPKFIGGEYPKKNIGVFFDWSIEEVRKDG